MRSFAKNPSRLRPSDEQGATLVEELVTVAIIGMGIVILVAMITTGVIGVRQVDDKVVAESLTRSQLELIKDAAYEADPVTNPYPGVAPIPNYIFPSCSIRAISYYSMMNINFIRSCKFTIPFCCIEN